uniref:Uncharacterized protein n=1 Tax=Coralloluteibacterium stylophorae TaxID=1776034 RepID=A0A8J7VQD5_9GAMM
MLLAGLLLGAGARAQTGGDVEVSREAWGDYAGVAGREARMEQGSLVLRWRWEVPGERLLQEYWEPDAGEPAFREVVARGEAPGTLVLDGSLLLKKRWIGTVQPDGRVLFVGKGLLKLPYLAGVGEDGTWQVKRVKLDDTGRVSAPVEDGTTGFAFVDAVPGTPAPGAATADEPAPATVAEAAAPETAPAAAIAAVPTPEPTPEATSGPAPAPAVPAAAPARSSFGVLDPLLGQRFVYHDFSAFLTPGEDGRSLLIQFGATTYQLVATPDPRVFDVPIHPDGLRDGVAVVEDDGTVEINLKERRGITNLTGGRHRLRFTANDYGGFDIDADYDMGGLNFSGWEWAWAHSYEPYTEVAAAQHALAAAELRRNQEEMARMDAESRAQQDAAFAGMLGDLADYAAQETQRRDEQDAFIADLQAQVAAAERERQATEALRMAAEAEARRVEAQAQMRMQAEQDARVAAEADARLAAAAAPAQVSGARSAGAAPVATAATAPAAPGGGGASTLDDPSTCVTPPRLGPDRACGKGYSATVTNQCTHPVDVRLCHNTERGWNCGTEWGVQPGDDWSYAVCASTGETFMSLRNTGTSGGLAEP